MTNKGKQYHGFSGGIWPLATLTVSDDGLSLHKSRAEIVKNYDDIKYVTVSWLGSIRFYFESNSKSAREESFTFLSVPAPELLTILAGKHVLAGGHVARRLLVSRLLIGAVYAAVILLVLAALLSTFTQSSDNSSLVTYKDFVVGAIFITYYSIASVWAYLTGNYDIRTTKTKDDDWFPW